MTNLYIIRHGEAICNVQPIIGGMKADAGLTERGIAQAQSLHNRLAATGEIAADVLIGSTLPRARQTTEIIAPALGIPITWDDDVREISVGEADGLTIQEAAESFGLDFDNDPYKPIAKGGESWGQFVLRVSSALHRITHTYADKTIVIVAHGGVIDCSFAYFLHMHTRVPTRLEFYPHNTSITHWQAYTHRDKAYWRLVTYNDIAHLHTIGANESPSWAELSVYQQNNK
jgi:probable phosphoglycerate mutase